MAHVLVIGASRGIGLETVRLALAAGHRVRAMARSADRIPLVHPRLERFSGDALDRERIREALAGIDAVVQALGVVLTAGMVLKPVSLFSDATRILVPAMKEAGVPRLICLTGFGAGDSRHRGGRLYDTVFGVVLGRVYDDKTRQERIVRDSGLDWVIARPVFLTDAPRSGRYQILTAPDDWRCGIISRADVADFLVDQITSDTHLGQTPVLAA